MKRMCFLVLMLALCFTLCGCGGMSGEEAALVYPDIVGQWGTDPFGEEFVLTLSEDGTCDVLGHSGTWTLDDKRSNEEWVELTLETEAMKYYVELDRVQGDRTTVHLWITDAKKENTIYEGEVFQPGTDYIFADLACQAVPELIGEWGSIYWNEESILTVNADGTCTLLRQSGRWCLISYSSTWPDIVIYVKLDNGKTYRVPFTLLTEMDRSYSNADIRIYDIGEQTYLWSDPEREYPVFRSVNRNQLIDPLEVASIALGSWSESAEKQPFATFREDGTCTIRGAEGLWSLDYLAYYQEKYRNGWDHCLLAEINGDEYDIRFSDLGSGRFMMYIVNQDDNIYILDATEVIKVK